MIVSINPTYYCNFRCDFCYLTETQLADRKLLGLDILENKLSEIHQYTVVDMVDLYGGEIGLLQESYIQKLCDLLQKFKISDINIITNLSMINEVILNPNIYLTVSYDFECREQHLRVWDNLLKLTRPFSILILASENLIKKNVDQMILQLNLLERLISVEIKPYSTNQSNCFSISHRDFELFIQQWMTSKITKKFEFVNETNIQKSLDKSRNAFSNDHVYITPNGDFAVLEFDINDREYFKSLESFEEYLKWANEEPVNNLSEICKGCEYYGHCLTEHYRYVRDLDKSCNGYKFLLDWYKING